MEVDCNQSPGVISGRPFQSQGKGVHTSTLRVHEKPSSNGEVVGGVELLTLETFSAVVGEPWREGERDTHGHVEAPHSDENPHDEQKRKKVKK